MSAFDAYVQAKFHGGVMAGGPCFTVIHDAETPLKVGYADSITEFFRVGPAAGTSAHAMVDPSKANKLLPDNVVAYAAGPKANPLGWHLEQAGYAKFKRPDWTTTDGLAQLQRVGDCLREVHDTWGIPKRWCTDDQLRRAAAGDRSAGGMTTHQQVARVLGGTTHTDPEENYPRDLLIEVVLGSANSSPDVPEDDMLTIEPGKSAVIPLPPGEKTVLLAVDEAEGGANIRVAVGWGDGKFHPLNADMAKVDGFTGWLPNGRAAAFPLNKADQTLTVTHRAGRCAVGVLVLR